jgi:hypothetical protein
MDTMQRFVEYGGMAVVAALAIRGIHARSGVRLAAYFFVSAAVVIVAATFLACWPHIYREIRLDKLGLDMLGSSDAERVRNVAPEHRAEAIRLYWSCMGVGWPITAFALAAYGLIYQFVV